MGKNQLQRSQKHSLDITRPYNLFIDIFQNFASELKAITQQLIYKLYIARQRAIPDFPGNKGPSRISPPCIINPFNYCMCCLCRKSTKAKAKKWYLSPAFGLQ